MGTTWGPHALHAGRHPARRLAARTVLAPPLTRTNAYSHVLGVKWASALVITQGAGLPLRDRSSDRNEQHRAALAHHRANAACPRRGRPIRDLHASVNRRVSALSTEDDDVPPWRARAPRVPLTRVIRGQQRSPMSPAAEYPQVALAQVSILITARPSKLAMRVRFPSPAPRTIW
ncbi:MAG: hypothetical protein LC808_17050 [Actinobacteria bacterium]|nr:hypothetical protein [Actinomycetota bacterium]